MYSIYSLKNRKESENIKYIGLTKQNVKDRLIQHIYKAKKAKRKNRTQSWILSVLNKNEIVEINIIETNILNIDIAIERESYYIKFYRSIGMDIKNETDGGSCAYDGSFWKGKKQKKEHSNKISNALKGRKISQEEIKKSVDGMIRKVYAGEDKNAIRIDQYDLNMNFIKTWPSIRRISSETGFCYRGIWNNINGNGKKSNGYIWKKSKN
jgi:hypothetical protein